MRLDCEVRDKQHPHYRCRGYIVQSAEGTMTVYTLFGKRMVRVELDDCKHGTDACFVEQKPGALRFEDSPRA